MSLAELVVNLAVKADTFTVRDFSKAIGDIPFSVASAITSMAGLSIGFVSLTQDVLQMTTGLQVFTSETGLNTKALQQWQQAAKEMGVSGDVATGAIERISQLVAGLQTGYGDTAALGALGRLGVRDLSGSAYDILERMQAAALNNPRAQSAAMLRAAGFDPALMRVFDIPASERARITPPMSAGAQDQMAQFTKELAQFNSTVMTQFVKVLKEIEPYMGDLTRALTLFIQTFGETAAFWLGKLHQSHMIQDVGNALTFDPQIVGRTLEYYGGEVTYNFNGLTDSEQIARRINEEHMRRETMQHTLAIKHFNNQGVP